MTKVLAIGAISLGISVLYLLWERLAQEWRLKKIPLRVCITGTRGKSSVTRLIAAALREAGYRTLAKTTGSKPVIIFPDGKEREIGRRGSASILEQKEVVRLASRFGVRAIVVELMSIQEECLSTEAARLLKPHLLAITNVRLDHLDLMGSSKSKIARVLASAIRPGCTVFVLEEETRPEFLERAGKIGAKIFRVGGGSIEPGLEFAENVRLATAVSDFVGITSETVSRARRAAKPDFGSLKVWTTTLGTPPREVMLVNGFAANDPESSLAVLSKIQTTALARGKRFIGLFNVREDRGDRSLQWLRALQEESWSPLETIVFVGYYPHALSLKKRLEGLVKARVLADREKEPAALTAGLVSRDPREAMVIGLGNMKGLGQALVEYWEEVGNPGGG